MGGHVEFGVAGLCRLLWNGPETFDVDVAAFVAADVDAELQVEVGAFDPFEGRVLEDGLRVFVARRRCCSPQAAKHGRQAGEGGEEQERFEVGSQAEILLESGNGRPMVRLIRARGISRPAAGFRCSC